MVTLAASLLSTAAFAQTLPPPPSQAIERLAPGTVPDVAPPLQPRLPEAQRGPGEAQQVPVTAVAITGNQALPDSALRPLTQGLLGSGTTLADIEATRIALLVVYRNAGYPYASITAGLRQGPQGATAVFGVIEGYIAEVKLEGDIGPAGTQVLRFLNHVLDDRPLRGDTLERALLLASDVPGVTVQGVLRPMQGEAGALQLVAQVSRKAVAGYITTDNRGYDLTGPWQGIASASANSFTSLGEQTELLVYGTEGDRQRFVQLGTEAFIGGSGLKVRIYAGAGRARPGLPLAAIGYEGYTRVAGGVVSYPIIRTRPASLWVNAGLDMYEAEVKVGDPKVRAAFDSVRAFRIGLEGQLLDSWIGFLPPASNSASIKFSQGLSGLGASSENDPIASRFGSDFDFRKVNAEVTRRQPITTLPGDIRLGVQGNAAVQWTDSVLPPSEKFFFGGNRLGRGFYAGQVTGDRAAAYSLELQFDRRFQIDSTPMGPVGLAAQFYLFRDYGRAFENNADPARRVSSYGLGLRLAANEMVYWDIEGVRRVSRKVDAAGPTVSPLNEDALYTRILLRF